MNSFERMPDLAFRVMSAVMAVRDLFFPYIDRRVATFGIREAMTVVDYGCGPGRYTTRFAKLVGANGRVYAVDVHRLAIQAVQRKMDRENLRNITPVLARGYSTEIPDAAANAVCALDIFFGVADPSAFLREIHRITKPEGCLIIDDGHQPRHETLRKIKEAGDWEITVETADYLKCRPIHPFSGLFG
jgi:ubiquinone/menaquinone biosynthesis C-methylase UbiE